MFTDHSQTRGTVAARLPDPSERRRAMAERSVVLATPVASAMPIASTTRKVRRVRGTAHRVVSKRTSAVPPRISGLAMYGTHPLTPRRFSHPISKVAVWPAPRTAELSKAFRSPPIRSMNPEKPALVPLTLCCPGCTVQVAEAPCAIFFSSLPSIVALTDPRFLGW